MRVKKAVAAIAQVFVLLAATSARANRVGESAEEEVHHFMQEEDVGLSLLQSERSWHAGTEKPSEAADAATHLPTHVRSAPQLRLGVTALPRAAANATDAVRPAAGKQGLHAAKSKLSSSAEDGVSAAQQGECFQLAIALAAAAWMRLLVVVLASGKVGSRDARALAQARAANLTLVPASVVTQVLTVNYCLRTGLLETFLGSVFMKKPPADLCWSCWILNCYAGFFAGVLVSVELAVILRAYKQSFL
eukprot:TRINITY_DN6504_c0_g3_i1.p1 TRINITY_DN6504_c0_g3~~TRINITY_DN6504_c0_g3_i1.p1  ORF type:complete len:248 (+),score=61.27 TRINITY_DN6504_c0_g3_i1:136-879(+)